MCLFAAASLMAQEADLSIGKIAPATASAGQDVSFDITLSNGGVDDATAAQFDDPLPAGMTFVSITQNSGAAFSCSDPGMGNNGSVTCSIGTMTAGTSANFTLVANIPMATPPGTTFSNTVTASSMTFDPNNENDQSTAGVTVPTPSADVSIIKNGPSSAAPNSDVTYTISISNAGPDPGDSTAWTDNLPGTMTFVSLTQNSGPTFNCTTGNSINCSIASFPAGASATFTLVGHIPAGTPSGTTFHNVATQTTTNDQTSENDQSSTDVTVITSDLGINKSGPATATAGGTAFDYVITLTNNGPDAASTARFNDSLPSGVIFNSITQNNGPSGSCGTPSPGTNGAVACTIPTLNNMQSAQWTVNVSVQSNVANGTVLTNTAIASSDSTDPNGNNDQSSVQTTVSTQADLAVTKTGPATGTAGTNVTYTITITNNGPSDAQSVSLADATPANTTFVSETQTGGPTFACNAGTCTIGTLANGASATFSYVVKINANAAPASMISNTAIGTTTTGETNPGNNSQTANTTVQSSADLVTTKTGPTSGAAGSNVTYTITVTNNGPSDAAAVTVTDVLPANTTYVSATPTQGSCNNVAGTVTCNLGTIANGAAPTISLVVTIGAAVPNGTMISNTATASSTTSDPTPGNNSGTSPTLTTGLATVDMSVNKVAAAGPYGTGRPLTYTITVTNNTAGGVATGVTMTDVLPAGATFVGANSSQGSCANAAGTVTCTIGTMTGIASVTVTLDINLPPTPGAFANTATVSANNPEANAANNSSTSSITVVDAASIPAASPLTLLLLGLALAGIGWMVTRGR